MPAIDQQKIRQLMAEQGLSVSALSRKAGLSRQAAYHNLSPGQQPLRKSFLALASALGVSPLELLLPESSQSTPVSRIKQLLDECRAGRSRSFEVLPALLLMSGRTALPLLQDLPPLNHQLLAAALAVSQAVSRKGRLSDSISFHQARSTPGVAFFFGIGRLDPERAFQCTPEPMRPHLVFGSFEMSDFSRHMDHVVAG